MPLRNSKNWAQYIKKSTSGAAERKFIRIFARAGEKEKDISGKMVKDATTFTERDSKFPRSDVKHVFRIVADTALRNVGAKKTVSAKNYSLLQKLTMQFYSCKRQEVNYANQAVEKYGKKWPDDVKGHFENMIKKGSFPLIERIKNICGEQMAARIQNELNELGHLLSESDF